MKKILVIILSFLFACSGYCDTAILQSSDGTAISASNPLNVTLAAGSINTSGINWTSVVNSEIQRSGINWNSLNADVNSAGMNWSNISGYASGNLLSATTGNGVNWSTNIVINGTVTSFSQGNVGIGTTVTNKLLDVGTNHPFTVDSSGTVTSSSDFISSNSGTILLGTASAQQAIRNNTASGNLQVVGGGGTSSGNFLVLQSTTGVGSGDYVVLKGGNNGATEIARFFGAGNVGIGSTNPQALLDLGTGGTLRSNRTTGIGWTIKTGANTACNTTCGTSACVFGFDTALAGSDVVACTDATSDTCVCAGP